MDVLRLKQRVLPGVASLRVYERLFAVMILSAYTISAPRVAAQSDLGEYDVKAAFLFNFAKFVDWPDASFADARRPIVIGALGENPFGDGLDRIVAGQTVKGRTIRIDKSE